MYKDLRGFPTETWRTLKPRKRRTYKKIQMYESVRKHESKHISFVHPNQRGIERTLPDSSLSTPPFTYANHILMEPAPEIPLSARSEN